ncbi:nuclear protein DGCR14 [Pyronema omphalodes]|nr:nuclear protein DGCR14 [Pyronema omphalodes]
MSSSATSPAEGSSKALIRKSTDTDLMPPPPVKRIKRPPKVLDEDTYTDALSEIIARDFFPGLLESKHQQEYLDALESRDEEWITEASRKLTEVMNTPQHRRRGTSFATPKFRDPLATPCIGSTPGATPRHGEASAERKKPAVETHLSLDAFQSKYTSEDNESFNKILDKQNEKHRKAYSFLWNGNHIPGFRQIEHQKRLHAQEEEKALHGERKLITAPDDRPAVPNTWKAEPRNGLMFTPDKSPPPPEKNTEKELPPKAVVYANTRMPVAAPIIDRPASPTHSLISDAIAGRFRPSESEADFRFGEAETPRVNGYTFVDAAPSPSPASLGAPPLTWGSVSAISSTSTASSAPTTSAPFKIAATPKRELLHHRMVEKVAKNKRTSNALLSSAATPKTGTPRMTSLAGGREIPSFKSSPALTPAGQRLWGNLTARRETGLRESVLGGKKAADTPREKGFRWKATPKAK